MEHSAKTTYQFFRKDPSIRPSFRAGVSLHSHTMHSEEHLDTLPRYTSKVPILRSMLDASVEYDRVFWTPPLSARQAYRLEEKQVQRRLRLPALVSLTDHDSIHAGTTLHVMERFRCAPISTEWTVPFGSTFFHLGVHNLPPARAGVLMQMMKQYTAHCDRAALNDVLTALNADPDVLVVLNHSLWDEKGIGYQSHGKVLAGLLQAHGRHIHALEVNGLRSWRENQEIMHLGARISMPVVSGGDRHGREPNAILNLTCADCFAGFVHEVRHECTSHVVFMAQYHESLKLRMIQTVVDVLRDYPENSAGRRTWTERVFYRPRELSEAVPLSSLWPDGGGPAIFNAVTRAVRFAQWRAVSSLIRATFALIDSARGTGASRQPVVELT